MTSMFTVEDIVPKPSTQVKSSPCNGSWMFAIVAVVVTHTGLVTTPVRLNTIAPLSLVSLVGPTGIRVKVMSIKKELVHVTALSGTLQVMVTSAPGKTLDILLNGIIVSLQKSAMGNPPPGNNV